MADANGHVDMVFNEIYDVIEKHYAHIDLRIGSKEGEHDRRHMQLAEQDRGGNQEVAAGCAIFPGRRTFGLVEFLKHAPTGCNESAAGFGQQQFAVGPDHELRAQTRLEFGDLSAHSRKRNAELARRRGQATPVDRREQRPDRVEPVHVILPFSGSLHSKTSGYREKSKVPSSLSPGVRGPTSPTQRTETFNDYAFYDRGCRRYRDFLPRSWRPQLARHPAVARLSHFLAYVQGTHSSSC